MRAFLALLFNFRCIVPSYSIFLSFALCYLLDSTHSLQFSSISPNGFHSAFYYMNAIRPPWSASNVYMEQKKVHLFWPSVSRLVPSKLLAQPLSFFLNSKLSLFLTNTKTQTRPTIPTIICVLYRSSVTTREISSDKLIPFSFPNPSNSYQTLKLGGRYKSKNGNGNVHCIETIDPNTHLHSDMNRKHTKRQIGFTIARRRKSNCYFVK